MSRFIALLSCFLFGAGCGEKRPQAEIERGQQAVAAALDAWKANDPPDKLKGLPDPVNFIEELQKTYALTEYAIVKSDGSDPDVIRYTVTLKLKDRKGKESEREVVYGVALKTPVVVSRDPYY
jgi:hypothetical protein